MELNANTGIIGYVAAGTFICGWFLAFIVELFLPPKSRCPYCYHLSRKKICPRCRL